MGKTISRFVFIPPKRNMILDDKDYEEVFIQTQKSKNKIQLLIINNKNALFTFLISHGNAEDVQGTFRWAKKYLLTYVNANVITYGKY